MGYSEEDWGKTRGLGESANKFQETYGKASIDIPKCQDNYGFGFSGSVLTCASAAAQMGSSGKVTKLAQLETGLKIKAALYIEEGEMV